MAWNGKAEPREIGEHDLPPNAAVELTSRNQSEFGFATLFFGDGEHDSLHSVRLRMNRYGRENRYLMLHLSVSLTGNSASAYTATTVAIVDMIVRICAISKPLYGEVSTSWGGHEPSTRLDLMLRRNQYISTAEATSVLRGYEWITVCPRELAPGIGDLVALRSGGAFTNIVEFPECLLLRSTKAPAEFDAAAAYRVWRALCPILPAGQPKAIPMFDLSPLVFQNAAPPA